MKPTSKIISYLVVSIAYGLFVIGYWMNAQVGKPHDPDNFTPWVTELLVMSVLGAVPFILTWAAFEAGRARQEKVLKEEYTLISKYGSRHDEGLQGD